VRRIAFVADLLSRNGVLTFVAAVSPFRAGRADARGRMGSRFVEVYVRASVEECERRDVKGLYERARQGEIKDFTGVSDPYEEPAAAELVLDTDTESAEASAARLVEHVERLAAGQENGAPMSFTAPSGLQEK
jgi:adenylylsulfate kinase-like enzyme